MSPALQANSLPGEPSGKPNQKDSGETRTCTKAKKQNKCIVFGLIATCEKILQDLGNCNPRMSQQYSLVVKEANVILGALIEFNNWTKGSGYTWLPSSHLVNCFL